MARISKDDGVLVNVMDWIYVRYSIFILPLIAILVWYFPYQDIAYKAVASEQAWTYLFPNLRRVLHVPFSDPQRVSGALLVLDILSAAWFAFSVVAGPIYVRAIKGWQARLAHYKKKDSLKLMLYSLVMMVSGGGWVFWADGGHSWMWGDFFYKNEIAFLLFNLFVAWFVIWTYLMMVALYLKLTKE